MTVSIFFTSAVCVNKSGDLTVEGCVVGKRFGVLIFVVFWRRNFENVVSSDRSKT